MEPPAAPPAPTNYMTVPAPSLNGESAPSNPAFNPNGLPGQEVHIAKVQNTIQAMEEQGMTSDPRFHSLNELKQRIQDVKPTPADPPAPGTPSSSTEKDKDKDADKEKEKDKDPKEKKGMDIRLINQFKAQLAAFRHAKNHSNIPAHLLSDATVQLPVKKPANGMPMPFEIPGEVNGEKIPYDLARLHHMMMVKSSKLAAAHPPPTSVDPNTIAKEREIRISGRIISRIKQLTELPYEAPTNVRTRAEIELRGLRLINVQAAVRREVLHALTMGTTVDQAINAFAYRRVKKHTLREARITEKLEKQQKMEQERRRRNRHMEFLQQTIQASKDFREFHRNNAAKLLKVRKAMAAYHANSEKERKKDEQKNEKLRMMKLMQEDEEGYRQLLDEKKDKRLVYLLQQTDEYVESLTGLVRQHQKTEKTRKKRERREARMAAGDNEDIPIVVRNCVTREVLKPEETPKAEELEAWLETHPGFEVVSRDAASDSDSDDERIEEEKKPEAEPDEPDDELDEEARNKRIIEKARNEEDEYDQKTRKQMESYYATAHKIKEKVVKQHSTMGGGDPTLQLKPYQIKGLEWMVSLYNNNLNGILADEMGLGKTIQTVSLITYLMEVKKINGPYLIIVPLSTISNWAMELDKWAPSVVTVIYKGTKDVRRTMDNQVKKGAFNVLLTTYDYVLKEKGILGKIKWKYMIIDEGHRMKNHNCKLTLTLNAYFSAQHRLLLTGTPLQNKLPELWALMNFLLPTIFSSCGTFEQWFNAPFATTGEKVELNEEETMLIIRRLHKVLRPFLLRRLKREVESQLPEKTEQLIKCDMSPLQRLMYRHMQKGLLLDSSRKEGRALTNTIMHLRKLCNHPFLFENVETDCSKFWDKEISGLELMRVAGKFELLDRILPKLQATGHRVLIFCQMTQLMTIMEDYFNWKGWMYLRLDGSTKPDERGELLKKYNAPESPYFLFMLSTRAGGLGLNLQTADTVIIFDSDWNPHQDMQAQDRAHRIGQKKEVRVFRLITVNSVEEKILAAARYKLNVDEKVIQAGKFDQRSTGAERRQMLEAIIRRADDDDEDEVPDDEAVNNIIARGDHEFDLFQQMDAERHAKEAAEGFNRLVRYEEIPENIIQSSKNFEEAEERRNDTPVQDESDSRRARKKVDYSADLMSDRDWLKTIDEPLPDSEDEDEAPRKSRKSDGPGKRGRKRRQRDDDDDDEDTSSSRTPSRKRRRDDRDPTQDHLNTLLEKLIAYTGSDGTQVSEEFMQLPSRRDLPEYYTRVMRPIDFMKIRKNLKSGRYNNLEALSADIELLCHNAQDYNRDDSDIYRDSKILQAVWEKLKQLSPASGSNTGNSSPATGGESGSATPLTDTAD